jgi:hypothetical protein
MQLGVEINLALMTLELNGNEEKVGSACSMLGEAEE